MFPSHITAFSLNGGEARLGWYWQGNPNLKPEKSINFDVSIEGENKNTYSKLTVFRNNIDNYITAYNTGHILDFHTDLNENTERGIYKFLYAPDMIYSFKNIGKAEITGLEWELKQKLSNKWKARLGYTYLHAINKSNPDMPRQLLDKPTHKIGIGVDYEDEKTGWSGSLWSDYYINMLDSNSVSGGGGYMTSGTAYERDPITKAIVLDPVTKEAKKIEGVSEVQDGGANTERLFKLASFIRVWGLVIAGLLIFIAVFLISNTIRITIISRSREIQIMRLVGAKNGYIRGPFLLEGAFIGLLGAALPSVLVYFIYNRVFQSVNPSLVGQNLSLITPDTFIPLMIGLLFLIGICIGSLGSGISMRRFLKI